MDRQLQQRLTGAAVIIALAVIFIPELVERPEPEPELTPAPALPSPAGTPTTTISLDPPAPLPEPVDETTAIEPLDSEPPDGESVVSAELPELPPLAEAEAPLEPDEPSAPELPFDQPPEEASEAPVEQARAPTPPPRRAEPSPTRTEPPPRRAEPPPRREPPPQPDERVAAITPPPEPALPPLEMISRPMGQNANRGEAQTRSQTQTRSQSQTQPRWMVQAGSFSNVSNANTLRDRLRSGNFSASLQQTVVDGRTMYRVQIGPHSSRDEGERTRERLRRELNIDGSIVPVYN